MNLRDSRVNINIAYQWGHQIHIRIDKQRVFPFNGQQRPLRICCLEAFWEKWFVLKILNCTYCQTATIIQMLAHVLLNLTRHRKYSPIAESPTTQ